MKSALLVLAGAAVAAARPSLYSSMAPLGSKGEEPRLGHHDEQAKATLGTEFLQWGKEHGKSYGSEKEMAVRYGIWKKNKAFVDAHNAEYNAGKKGFNMKMNQFGDMENWEYRSQLLGKRGAHNRAGGAIGTFRAKGAAAPDTWNWIDQGIVNDVKDQGQCGSCWAFSAVAAMEGAFNNANKGKMPSVCTSKCNGTPCCSFSEQELVDCTRGGLDTCDEGGEMHDGIMEIIDNQGAAINLEADYPYTSGGGTSKGVCNSKSAVAVPTGFKGYNNVTQADEGALKEASYASTVVSIGIDASQMSFQFYWSGIYDEPKCMNKPEELDHGVSLVGYGSQGAQDYWLVRNSWGKAWGDNGYIMMSRGKDNQCGVATDAIYVTL